MRNTTIGVVGGLGPETTANFYLEIINLSKKLNKVNYPSILIHNLPLTFKVEEETAVSGENINSILPFLLQGTKKLLKAKVSFVVIPCNTVHVFIKQIRQVSSVPVLNIVEETTKKIIKDGHKKVGLLASKETIKSKLYVSDPSNAIEVLLPSTEDQEKVALAIKNLLGNKKKIADRNALVEIIQKFENDGAEAVILGCTDLPLLIKPKDSSLPLINTLDILAESAAVKANNIDS